MTGWGLLSVSFRRRRVHRWLRRYPWPAGRWLDLGGTPRSPLPPRVLVNLTGRPDVLADAAALPFCAASARVVTCLETLQYVADPAKACREIRRVLAPDGLAVLVVPGPYVAGRDPTVRQTFLAPALTALLAEAGLGIVERVSLGGAWMSLADEYRASMAAEKWRFLCGGWLLWLVFGALMLAERWADAPAPVGCGEIVVARGSVA